MKMRRIVCITVLVLLVGVSLLACGPAPAPTTAPKPTTPAPTAAPKPATPTPTPSPSPAAKPAKVTDLLMASTSLTSGYYVGAVNQAKIINQNVPDVRVTVVETGAGYDNVIRILRGDVQFSTITYWPALGEAYSGQGRWKDKPNPQMRALWPDLQSITLFLVRTDSGIKTLRELEGKKFCLGVPGSDAEQQAVLLFQLMGIKPDAIRGSLADAADMVKDRRAVGLCKASAPDSFDSALADINVLTPLTILSLSESEITKLRFMQIGMGRGFVPAGTYTALKNQGDIISPGNYNGFVTSSNLPEDIGYKMVKALNEHWAEVVALPLGNPKKPADVFVDWLKVDDKTIVAPLHAGTVRYLKELGKTVPDILIPPEYKK